MTRSPMKVCLMLTATVRASTGVLSATSRVAVTVIMSGIGASKVRLMVIALCGRGFANSMAVSAFSRPKPYLGL